MVNTITVVDSASSTATGQGGQSIITGTPTTGSAVSQIVLSLGSLLFTVSGTWTGTLQFECSGDNGTTWTPCDAIIVGTNSTVKQITANGIFKINVASITNVRARAVNTVTGTANIAITVANATDYIHASIDASSMDIGTVAIDQTTPGTTNGVVVNGNSPQETLIDYNSGTNATYIGKALPGSTASATAWTIQLLTYDGNNNVTSIKWGSVTVGVPATNLVWNNRASYTYS